MGNSGMHFIPHLEKDIRRHWSGLAHNSTSQVLLQGQRSACSWLVCRTCGGSTGTLLNLLSTILSCMFTWRGFKFIDVLTRNELNSSLWVWSPDEDDSDPDPPVNASYPTEDYNVFRGNLWSPYQRFPKPLSDICVIHPCAKVQLYSSNDRSTCSETSVSAWNEGWTTECARSSCSLWLDEKEKNKRVRVGTEWGNCTQGKYTSLTSRQDIHRVCEDKQPPLSFLSA